jgi:2'-5' RNA ligase
MIRTFISLPVPDETLDNVNSLIQRELGGDYYKYRWVNKQNLHLTLKFIGETDEKTVEKITESLKISRDEFQGLELEFSKFGFFERDRKPAIFWLGCNFNPLLIKFVNLIENSLAELGIPKEVKPFKSHLTLIRLKGDEDAEPLKNLCGLSFNKIEFKPGGIFLMKSELSPKGSKYFVIKNLVN